MVHWNKARPKSSGFGWTPTDKGERNTSFLSAPSGSEQAGNRVNGGAGGTSGSSVAAGIRASVMIGLAVARGRRRSTLLGIRSESILLSEVKAFYSPEERSYKEMFEFELRLPLGLIYFTLAPTPTPPFLRRALWVPREGGRGYGQERRRWRCGSHGHWLAVPWG